MAEGMDTIARQTFTTPIPTQKKKKKVTLNQCQDYRTINLISHPSKIMFRLILNRLNAKAEEVLAEEKAGFGPGRSTVEQIFNSRVIMGNHLQHQCNVFNNFIDFKKAFDRV